MTQDPDPTPADDERLQLALEALIAGRTGGVYALITQDGEPVFAGSAGTASLTTPRPLKANDRFRIASLTKTYIATVILQLAAEARLALSDPVERWLPDSLPHGDIITVDHLLSMRSGLPDYVPCILGNPPHPTNLQRYFPPEELVQLALASPTQFEPGSQVGYANTNYILLGIIIENVTGQRVDAQLWQRIFDPLRLDDTEFATVDPHIRGPHATAYMRLTAQAPIIECTTFTPSEAWACGAITSTPADVATFLDKLLGGALLPPEQLALMKTTRPWHDDLSYGYGLARHQLPSDQIVYGHGGTHFGVNSYAFRSDAGRTLVLYRNCWERDEHIAQSPFIRAAFDLPSAD